MDPQAYHLIRINGVLYIAEHHYFKNPGQTLSSHWWAEPDGSIVGRVGEEDFYRSLYDLVNLIEHGWKLMLICFVIGGLVGVFLL